jgi:hypothetical protein
MTLCNWMRSIRRDFRSSASQLARSSETHVISFKLMRLHYRADRRLDLTSNPKSVCTDKSTYTEDSLHAQHSLHAQQKYTYTADSLHAQQNVYMYSRQSTYTADSLHAPQTVYVHNIKSTYTAEVYIHSRQPTCTAQSTCTADSLHTQQPVYIQSSLAVAVLCKSVK